MHDCIFRAGGDDHSWKCLPTSFLLMTDKSLFGLYADNWPACLGFVLNPLPAVQDRHIRWRLYNDDEFGGYVRSWKWDVEMGETRPWIGLFLAIHVIGRPN